MDGFVFFKKSTLKIDKNSNFYWKNMFSLAFLSTNFFFPVNNMFDA